MSANQAAQTDSGSSTSPVKGVAVVGTGIIYKNHAKALEAIPSRARLVGVAELDESKLAAATQETFVPVATQDYRELLARDDIDVVAVCTPPMVHEEIVRESLAAGKVVICEKPLANNLATVDRMVEISREYPGRLGTVYQLRYLPEIQQMIRLRDEGALGNCCLAISSAMVSSIRRNRVSLGGGVGMSPVAASLLRSSSISSTSCFISMGRRRKFRPGWER